MNIRIYSYLKLFLVFLCIAGCSEKVVDPPDTMRDIDGNLYKTIKIGRQVWMAENLRVTKYRNGVVIPAFTSNTEWSGASVGLCSDYEFIGDSVRGKLYNWHAVQVYENLYLAPEGWHIPTEAEWLELINNLGGMNEAGGRLKDTLYWSPLYLPKSSVSGFNAVPTGIRDVFGRFQFKNEGAYYWTSTINPDYIYHRVSVIIFSMSDNIQVFGSSSVNDGFAVRCIRD